MLLSSLRPIERAVVVRVDDEDPAFLRHLEHLGLHPGAQIETYPTQPTTIT